MKYSFKKTTSKIITKELEWNYFYCFEDNCYGGVNVYYVFNEDYVIQIKMGSTGYDNEICEISKQPVNMTIFNIDFDNAEKINKTELLDALAIAKNKLTLDFI